MRATTSSASIEGRRTTSLPALQSGALVRREAAGPLPAAPRPPRPHPVAHTERRPHCGIPVEALERQRRGGQVLVHADERRLEVLLVERAVLGDDPPHDAAADFGLARLPLP